MRFQHIELTGTALVALAAALLLIATPSFGRQRHISRSYHHTSWTHRERAQRNHHYANSTPRERTQTRALNHREAREWGLTANGETGIQARRENIVAHQRYRQALDAYGVQQQQYASDIGLYRVRLGYYNLHRREPSEWWRAQYGTASPMGPSGLPRSALLGAEIDEPDGHVVGQIIDVHLYPAAHIARVEVALAHEGGIAWVDSQNLRYDAADRVMFTDMAADDLREGSEPR
jgi:hypothetical protein